ncbi:MAG: type I glyceraldehyde-3-phosphate dehydrogenase [Candidatus Taylorbacteria bacterium]|nr:type I glyceraldehyde-3-phosphate dehydrogenase [Candidatus Taylorbacteria bacterium]
MQSIKVAINGCGRIGRAFLRVSKAHPEIEVVAVNDLATIESISYLLKYDTVYKKAPFTVLHTDKSLIIDGKEIAYLSEKDATKLPWKDFNIDVVVESTGLFTSYEKAKAHLEAGAKRVVITAPAKGESGDVKGETILMGINEDKLSTCQISSNASCTTNAGSPLIAILDEAIGIEKAILNTVHGYTASQAIVDGPSKKDLREGRAAAQNIVPSSTGAAIATTKAFTKLAGKFDGISIRVPVIVGSIVDITFIAKRDTTAEEVNSILKRAAMESRWSNIFAVTEEPLVSSDIIGEAHASIADLEMTRVVDGNLVKVLGWYDNEMGYTHTLVDHVIKAGQLS